MSFLIKFTNALRRISLESNVQCFGMLRFLRILISAIVRVGGIFNPQRLDAHHALHKAGHSIGRRVTLPYLLNPRSYKVFFEYNLVYLTLVIMLSVFSASLYGAFLKSDYPYIHYITSYLPSVETQTTALSWLFCASFSWTLMVYANHWNEISVMFTGANDFTTAIANMFAFIYVTNIGMLQQFVSTLVYHPTNLLDTVVVKEMVLMLDLMEHGFWEGYSLIVNLIPSARISGALIGFGDMVGNLFHSGLTMVGACLYKSWAFIVGKIYAGIAPAYIPAFAAPIVTPIFKGAASVIAGVLVWWILRLFFGFPF